MLFTDEYPAYGSVGKKYTHRRIRHRDRIYVGLWTGFLDDLSERREYAGHHRIRHKERVYVDGNVHTNTIEGFFSNLKRGIDGTYHAVSKRWLQAYLNEYAWRYNHRDDARAEFESLLLRSARR